MRWLSPVCIAIAAALHVAAWRLLDPGVLKALADETLPVALPVTGGIEVEPPESQAPAVVPLVPRAATSAGEPAPPEVNAWRPAQQSAKETAAGGPGTAASASGDTEGIQRAAPAERGPPGAWRPGPAPGLRVPPAILRGKAAADLVIDAGDPTFRERAQQLGMRFILFQDGSLSFFLELQGDDLRTAVRRTAVDLSEFSRRARDLAGVRAFDRLRDDVAEHYGLEPARCRLAALVPLAVDRTFREAETAALAGIGRPADQIVALCGVLCDDRDHPLRIRQALLTDGQWLEVSP